MAYPKELKISKKEVQPEMGKLHLEEFNTPSDQLLALNLLERKKIMHLRWIVSLFLILGALALLVITFNSSDKMAEEETARHHTSSVQQTAAQCTDSANPCRLSLVESLPEGINYTAKHPSTYQTWRDLLAMAQHTVEITSFYWTLRSADIVPGDPSSQQGENVFQAILEAGTKRGLQVRIVQSKASKSQPNLDTEYLTAQNAAEVRTLDFPRLVGGGVLHTKMWLIDRQHVYVGSANMDWRSLTQVKELGAVFYNCSCLATDMAKLFDVYWFLGQSGATVPERWPEALSTQYNVHYPMNISVNNTQSRVYIASSPPPLCPNGRTTDLEAILNVIETADKFVSIAVMDYFPLLIYGKNPRFWGDIDTALRTAAINRRVHVRLLVSHWNHTRPSLKYFLTSLQDLSGAYPGEVIQVKWFEVPSTPEQARIPYARVNHNKYMVTDNTAYIGTSNWSGDYFLNTGGIGLVVREAVTRQQLEDIFERDWNSPYAKQLQAL